MTRAHSKGFLGCGAEVPVWARGGQGEGGGVRRGSARCREAGFRCKPLLALLAPGSWLTHLPAPTCSPSTASHLPPRPCSALPPSLQAPGGAERGGSRCLGCKNLSYHGAWDDGHWLAEGAPSSPLPFTPALAALSLQSQPGQGWEAGREGRGRSGEEGRKGWGRERKRVWSNAAEHLALICV